MAIPAISEANLTAHRAQQELRDYVDQQHHQFGVTTEGKNAIRLANTVEIKRFKEELWALALYADAFYAGRADVLFRLMPIGSSYDGEEIIGTDAFPLEITQALGSNATGYFSGLQEKLRMVHLAQFGGAPSTVAAITRDATSKQVQKTSSDAVNHKELLAECFEAIREAVARKSTKCYPGGTSLIVEFKDDFIRSKDDQCVLDDWARLTLPPIAIKFKTLYLVSDRQRLAFEYPSTSSS